MFEEVPPVRRGLAGLRFRRVAFGPFAIGGGLALLAIGGSVAVAATVFTATSLGSAHPGNNDVPAHRQPVVAPTSRTSTASTAGSPSSSGVTSATRTAVPPVPASAMRSGSVKPPSWSAPRQIVPPGTRVPSAGRYSPVPEASSGGPAGNALVYITGYSRGDRQLVFQFATQESGSYQVSSQTHYHAGLAAGLTIISGGTLCPPAGSSCTVAELIAAAPAGFFAEVALGPADEFESIVEVDNATNQAIPAPSPSPDGQGFAPTASPSPSG